MTAWANDIVLEAPPDAPVAELILGRVRRLWLDAWFQDADEDEVYRLSDIQVVVRGGRSREFYIYQDRSSVEAWKQDGATPENLETMLYFLIGDISNPENGYRQLTLVCGEKTETIRKLILDLNLSFRARQSPPMAA